eukprot:3995441-Amphidinium_carterae.1
MSDLVFVNEQLTAPSPAWAVVADAPASSERRDLRPSQQQKRPKGGSKGKGPSKVGKGGEVCRGYNNGTCKMGEKCRYRHVCST